MESTPASLIAVVVFALLHALAGTRAVSGIEWRHSLLSAAAGISIGYIFLELMPDLAERQDVIEGSGLLSGVERHVYLLALVGLVIAFWVEVASRKSRRRNQDRGHGDYTTVATFRLSIATFMIYNAAISYAVTDSGDGAVQPLWLFTIAMGLHFLVNDHALAEHHGDRYRRVGRWALIAGLVAGWLIGSLPALEVSPEALALVLAYIAGGTVLNVLRYEIPDTDRPVDVAAFVVGATLYGALVLSLGSSG